MKAKNIVLLSALGLLASCANIDVSSSKAEGSSNGGGETVSYKYEADQKFQNFLKDKAIYNETVLLVERNGEISGSLLYAPTKILSVRDYTLEKEFAETEYKVVGNKIIRTENSTMPYFTSENAKGNDLDSSWGITPAEGKKAGETIAFTEGPGIVMHLINVSYEHEDEWQYEMPSFQGERLPNTLGKLENKEHLTVGFYGDSIMSGCNSSAKLGIQPYLGDFPTASVEELKRRYGYDNIEMFNSSKGGMLSDWGEKNVDSLVNAYDPDIVFVGFGMNDGSWNVKPATFIDHVETVLNRIQLHNSEVEVVLVATILANPDAKQNSIQESYLEPLRELASNYEGVALMDMTTYSKNLYKTKKGLDILANNINHPNDFLVRGYVSNILATLIKDY